MVEKQFAWIQTWSDIKEDINIINIKKDINM